MRERKRTTRRMQMQKRNILSMDARIATTPASAKRMLLKAMVCSERETKCTMHVHNANTLVKWIMIEMATGCTIVCALGMLHCRKKEGNALLKFKTNNQTCTENLMNAVHLKLCVVRAANWIEMDHVFEIFYSNRQPIAHIRSLTVFSWHLVVWFVRLATELFHFNCAILCWCTSPIHRVL